MSRFPTSRSIHPTAFVYEVVGMGEETGGYPDGLVITVGTYERQCAHDGYALLPKVVTFGKPVEYFA